MKEISCPVEQRPTRDLATERTIDLSQHCLIRQQDSSLVGAAFCVYDHDHARQLLLHERTGLAGHGGVYWTGCTIVFIIIMKL